MTISDGSANPREIDWSVVVVSVAVYVLFMISLGDAIPFHGSINKEVIGELYEEPLNIYLLLHWKGGERLCGVPRSKCS